MSSRYVLHEVCRGQYRFTLTSHRGQVLLTSGLLMEKESALRKIDITRRLARNSRNYELRRAENGNSYFLIKTAQGETLVYSACYPDAESLQAAINLVKSNTRGAQLEDLAQHPAARQEKPAASGRGACLTPTENREMRPLTHIALRLSDNVYNVPGAIHCHILVSCRYGAVWLDKPDRGLPGSLVETLNCQIEAGHPTCLFLIDPDPCSRVDVFG